jgi:hypothetical protein
MEDENVYEVEIDEEEEVEEEETHKIEATEAARTKSNPHGNKNGMNRAGLPSKKKYKAGSGVFGINEEVEKLKKQNSEYKKALVLFKDKLNEVAVFNANLAYAVRLFTEHTTTKQEKLDIMKRFDTDKQKEMIMIDYNETKQNAMSMRNSLNSNSNNGDMKKQTSDLQSHFPYSNKGDVIVRPPLKLHPLITITTAATFAVGSTPGSIDFAYSSKPSTGSRPLSGITHDLKPPEEWDFARSKDLPEREISHFHNKAIVTSSSSSAAISITSTGSKKK